MLFGQVIGTDLCRILLFDFDNCCQVLSWLEVLEGLRCILFLFNGVREVQATGPLMGITTGALLLGLCLLLRRLRSGKQGASSGIFQLRALVVQAVIDAATSRTVKRLVRSEAILSSQVINHLLHGNGWPNRVAWTFAC